MKVDLTQDGLFDWKNPEHVEKFERLLDEIRAGTNDRLIEFTIALLGTLGPNAPEHVRQSRSLAALYLRTAWIDVDDRWKDGTLRDLGEVLGRMRQPNWRQDAHVKHHRTAPRVFAEMSFDISRGCTRSKAADLARAKFGVSDTQIDQWYDNGARELLSVMSKPAELLVDNQLIRAFCDVAQSRGADQATVFDELRNAVARRSPAKGVKPGRPKRKTSGREPANRRSPKKL